MPSRPKLFLWTSDKYSWPPWPWMPTVESFYRNWAGLTLCVSSKIWKQQRWSKAHRRNVHRQNDIAEISHSVGNLYSSAVYDQGQPTLIFNTISCVLQLKATNDRFNTAGTTGNSKPDYWKKQIRTFQISENRNFTSNHVMNYVIGAFQWILPRDPQPFNPALEQTRSP